MGRRSGGLEPPLSSGAPQAFAARAEARQAPAVDDRTVVFENRVAYPHAPMSFDSRRSRAALAAVLLPAVSGLVHGQDEPAESAPAVLELTLEEAVRIALDQNLDVVIEEETTAIERYSYLGSWGAFDPIVSVTGSARDSETEGFSDLSGGDVIEEDELSLSGGLLVPFKTGGSFQLDYSHSNLETNNQFSLFDTSTTDVVTAQLTQPLLRGAWTRYATTDQQEARIRFEKQSERNREVRQNLLLSVHNAYWDLVAAREEFGVRQKAVELGEKQLVDDRRREEVGVGTQVDVLQAETNVATQEEQRLLAESNVRAAADALRALLFRKTAEDAWGEYIESWDVPIEPLTPLPDPDPSALHERVGDVFPEWSDSLLLAIERRSELKQQRLEIDAAEVRLLRAQSNVKHQLDLTLTARSTGFDGDSSEALEKAVGYDFPSYTAALTWSFPIFNRTADNAERAARAAVRLARLTYQRIEMGIVSEVRAAVRDLHYQAEAVQAAVKRVTLAKKQLEAEQSAYREGLSTTFQVLDFQQQLSQALSSEKAARAAYAKAVAALARAEGRLGEEPEP